MYMYLTKPTDESVYIAINGPETVVVEYGNQYDDPGAIAIGLTRTNEPKELAVLTSEADVNVKKVGDYTVTYKALYNEKEYIKTRTVKVVDTEKPIISVSFEDAEEPNWLTGPRDFCVKALDNCDGDISDKIERNKEDGKITFRVFDSSGNIAQTTLKEEQPVTAPVIKFTNDDEYITVNVGQKITLSPPTAYDGKGINHAGSIKIEGTYDINTPGTYILTYTLTNYIGETVKAQRTIEVKPLVNPKQITDPNKIIRLTFENGPNDNTSTILQILEKYAVPATFFINSAYVDSYENLSKYIKAGSAIGLYSYTAEPADVYEADDFFAEYRTVQADIKNQANIATHLFRFPGGSIYGIETPADIMNNLRNDITKTTFQYYDWTIDPNDLQNTSENIINIVTQNIELHKLNIVRLHEASDNTVQALPQIIEWGIQHGYTFLAIK